MGIRRKSRRLRVTRVQLESVPQAWSNRCRVGETHHRKAVVGLKIGGFHPPYNIDFPTLPGQTLIRQGNRSDFPVLCADTNGMKLLKLVLGSLIIGDELKLVDELDCLLQQGILMNPTRPVTCARHFGQPSAKGLLDGHHGDPDFASGPRSHALGHQGAARARTASGGRSRGGIGAFIRVRDVTLAAIHFLAEFPDFLYIVIKVRVVLQITGPLRQGMLLWDLDGHE